MFIASAVQGSIGFGGNVLAVPALTLLDPAFVPGPVLFAGFGINVLMLLRDRDAASLRPVSSAVGGRIVGTAAGVGALTVLSQRGLSILVAVTVLAIIAISSIAIQPERSTRNLVAAGTLSGFSASTAGIGGPPVALLFQNAEGPEVRGSLGALFVVGNIISLSGLALVGRFGAEELQLGLALTPAALLGFASTKWLVPVLDRNYTRQAIILLSTLAAIALIGRLILA